MILRRYDRSDVEIQPQMHFFLAVREESAWQPEREADDTARTAGVTENIRYISDDNLCRSMDRLWYQPSRRYRISDTDRIGIRKPMTIQGCYVFRYLSRRTAFYPTVIRRDLENVFL